jgi:glycosyltransferase involved in cell wall biosynthesis
MIRMPVPGSTATPTVSVVLATYNGERFIEKQLLSILRQTLPPSEIIVSDDNSRDATVRILEAIASTSDIPIVIARNERNLGFSENFLSASSRATGELIAFCDQDDIWSSRKLEVCANAFAEHTVLVVHSAHLIDESERPLGPFTQGLEGQTIRGPLRHDPWGVFFGFTMVFRRSLLDVVPFSRRGRDYITGEPQLAHDRWVLYLANMMGNTTEIGEPLVDYRQHGGNLFGASSSFSLRPNQEDTVRVSARYIDSAAEQLNLISLIDDSTATRFPLFNREAAQEFWRNAQRQQIARSHIYLARGRIAAAGLLTKNLLVGVYSSVHSGRFRPRSVLKDLIYILTAPRFQLRMP